MIASDMEDLLTALKQAECVMYEKTWRKQFLSILSVKILPNVSVFCKKLVEKLLNLIRTLTHCVVIR
jgi:hypothetical protein